MNRNNSCFAIVSHTLTQCCGVRCQSSWKWDSWTGEPDALSRPWD